ncbi:CRISPR-associated protein Cas5 [Methanobacterium sp.]|uniref:CRISPR-associated protein Cas5 n=1 Tax=Methanobacterium sp. TaxID=2164 RepID=UPI0025DAAC81|nr:CRISPR-associated protein Cas5 [Methanobacterium sp.]MBI5460454.1 CRISPR-associated protein Cas5 [Methanobacterium sp.]
MFGLKFRIEALYFTNFRKSTSTSLINTYSIPPFTTLRGMISNALGLKRDDLRVQDWIKIGIKPQNNINLSTEMTKVLKLKGTGKQYQKTFPSAPIFKEFLVNPIYDVYVGSEQEVIEKIYNALKNPKRPLYIGASDELVDLMVFEPVQIEKKPFNEVCGVVEGIYEDCIIEKIPYKFIQAGRNFSLEYKTISIPKKGKICEEMDLFDFEGEGVVLV